MLQEEAVPLVSKSFPESSKGKFCWHIAITGTILTAKIVTAAGFTVFGIRLFNLPDAAATSISIVAVISEFVVNLNKFPGIYEMVSGKKLQNSKQKIILKKRGTGFLWATRSILGASALID